LESCEVFRKLWDQGWTQETANKIAGLKTNDEGLSNTQLEMPHASPFNDRKLLRQVKQSSANNV